MAENPLYVLDIVENQSEVKKVIIKNYEQVLERLDILAFYSPDFADKQIIKDQIIKLEQFIDELKA